jgi:hypothetical protein
VHQVEKLVGEEVESVFAFATAPLGRLAKKEKKRGKIAWVRRWKLSSPSPPLHWGGYRGNRLGH